MDEIANRMENTANRTDEVANRIDRVTNGIDERTQNIIVRGFVLSRLQIKTIDRKPRTWRSSGSWILCITLDSKRVITTRAFVGLESLSLVK